MLTKPSNVLPLHLKQTFPPIIWIFTEGEDDGIKSKLPFKIFSTLTNSKKMITTQWPEPEQDKIIISSSPQQDNKTIMRMLGFSESKN